MKRPECLIHAGIHKAGSTAIQNALDGYDDGETVYANLGDPNHSVAIETIFSPDSFFYHWHRMGLTRNEIKEKKQLFRELLHDSASKCRHRLIISAENISIMGQDTLENFFQFLSIRFEKISVVMIARDPLDHKVSLTQELIKHGASEFSSSYFDGFESRYNRLANVFGAERIIVIQFERKRLFNDDIVELFFSEFNLRDNNSGAYTKANIAISEQATKVCYILNTLGMNIYKDPIIDLARWKLVAALQSIILNKRPLDPNYFINLVDFSEYEFLNNFVESPYIFPGRNDRSLTDYLSTIDQETAICLQGFLSNRGIKYGFNDDHKALVCTLFYYFVAEEFRSHGVINGVLLDADAETLRDVALKIYYNKSALTEQEALALMRLAFRARPNGPFIKEKIAEWCGESLSILHTKGDSL